MEGAPLLFGCGTRRGNFIRVGGQMPPCSRVRRPPHPEPISYIQVLLIIRVASEGFMFSRVVCSQELYGASTTVFERSFSPPRASHVLKPKVRHS